MFATISINCTCFSLTFHAFIASFNPHLLKFFTGADRPKMFALHCNAPSLSCSFVITASSSSSLLKEHICKSPEISSSFAILNLILNTLQEKLNTKREKENKRQTHTIEMWDLDFYVLIDIIKQALKDCKEMTNLEFNRIIRKNKQPLPLKNYHEE
ncbi:hypothetical protein Scep_022413 [Stephania cephalantha]|uniref:Uncharacterized protein n=1 Tax=Stephania cephalantha TaxID=152367 RepID=A0AAP0I2N5_9MAGN